jgi:hypothetical protein
VTLHRARAPNAPRFRIPHVLHSLLDWLDQHRSIVYGIAGSLLLGLLGLIGGTIFVVRMRPDALTKRRLPWKDGKGPKSARAALWLGRNILGWLLIAAGLAMLLLPGPGLVVLLLGLTMADFPGKHRVQLWLFSRRRILGPINRMRKRFGRPPLEIKPAA